jgi:peptidyl-prolyl cis-trans isomerase C
VQAMLRREFDEKGSPESIPDADVKAYYEAHLSEFVRPALRRASELRLATEAEAKALLAEAKAADLRSFRELVKNKSTHDDGRLRGGDLRYFDATGKIAEETADGLDPALAKAAFALQQTGDTSEIVKTEQGFSILKLTGKREAHEEKPADAASRIRSRLWRERRDRGIDELLAKLRVQHKPEVHPELLDQIKLDGAHPLPPRSNLPAGFPKQKPQPAR